MYCPPPVTVYIRGPLKGYISPYYKYFPTVTEGGQYPRFRAQGHMPGPRPGPKGSHQRAVFHNSGRGA